MDSSNAAAELPGWCVDATHVAIAKDCLYAICHDPTVGHYLHQIRQADEASLSDYLQDTLEVAIEQAHDDFGVDPSSWIHLP